MIDAGLHPEKLARFMVYRFSASLICLILVLLNRRLKLGYHSLYLGVAGFYAVGLAIILMVVDLGGYSTSYYAGLNLVFIGFGMMIPVGFSVILIHATSLYLIYLLAVLFLCPPGQVALFAANNLFIVSTLMLMAAASHINHNLRLREYLLRLDLEKARHQLQRYSEGLEIRVKEQSQNLMQKMEELRDGEERLLDTQRASIYGLAKLAESRDRETGQHLERIQVYCGMLTRELKNDPLYKSVIDEEFINNVAESCVLHDLGKVAIPDEILLKPDRLTPEEYEIIKTHAAVGGDALATIEDRLGGRTYLRLGREIAYFHHERYDGQGYPLGLKGERIPLAARIGAVVDVYDALTSNRCYRRSMSHDQAVALIAQGRGTQFDPVVSDAFLRIQARLAEASRQIQAEERAEGEGGEERSPGQVT